MASLGEDLVGVVNKLQDLVFNTIGNDSLDLPQLVSPGFHTSGPGRVPSSRAATFHMILTVISVHR